MTVVPPNPILTTVLTGFLGAGKTSYLNRLLSCGVPANSLILVNDFGQINVDADLIEYQDEHIIRLNNGCVCCTLGGSMAEKLAEIGRLDPAPAALYIETSGVANAARVADMIRVSRRFALADVWCFIDVSLAQTHSNDPRVNKVWQQQIKSATQLMLNRLSTKYEIPAVLNRLLEQSVAAVHYDFSFVSQELITADPPARQRQGGWHSFSFESTEAIQIDELKQIIIQAAASLYRAKGLLLAGPDSQTFVLQYTGRQWNITPSAKKISQTQLVFIGEKKGLQSLKQQLQTLKCLETLQ